MPAALSRLTDVVPNELLVCYDELNEQNSATTACVWRHPSNGRVYSRGSMATYAAGDQ